VKALVVTRVDVVLILVNTLQLRATKTKKLHRSVNDIPTFERLPQHREESLNSLEQEAFQVIALQRHAGIENAFRERGNAHGSVLGLPVLPATSTNGGILSEINNVREETSNGVLVADSTLVPVIRDTFVTENVFEGAALSSDGKERHQLCAGRRAFRELGGFVGHHADWEGEAYWSDKDTGKWWEEKVAVVFDRVVEACNAEVDEVVVLGIGSNSLDECVVVLLKLADLDFVVVAVQVKIATRGRAVYLVLVV
jgi:hypothetical protein